MGCATTFREVREYVGYSELQNDFGFCPAPGRVPLASLTPQTPRLEQRISRSNHMSSPCFFRESGFTICSNLLVALLVVGGALHAQNKTNEAAVHNVPQAFAAAWAKHDGHQLAKITSIEELL